MSSGYLSVRSIDRLTVQARAILDVLALYGLPITTQKLPYLLAHLDLLTQPEQAWSDVAFQNIIAELTDTDLIDIKARAIWCSAHYHEFFIEQARARDDMQIQAQRMLTALNNVGSDPMAGASEDQVLMRQLNLYLYAEQGGSAVETYQALHALSPPRVWLQRNFEVFGAPFIRDRLRGMDVTQAAAILFPYLSCCFQALVGDNGVLDILKSMASEDATGLLTTRMQTFLLLRGESLATSDLDTRDPLHYATLGTACYLRGQLGAAVASFSGYEGTDLLPVQMIFHLVAAYRCLSREEAEAISAHYEGLGDPAVCAFSKTLRLNETEPLQERSWQPLCFLYNLLVTSSAGDLVAETEIKIKRAEASGWSWFAGECRAVLAELGNPGIQSHFPALSMIQALVNYLPWEQNLEDLWALVRDEGAERKKTRQRLAWFLSARGGVTCRIQKRSKTGNWSRGRKIDLDRLPELPELQDFGSDRDKHLAAMLDRQRRAFKTCRDATVRSAILDHLVGHPLLFREENPKKAVTLIRKTPCLQVSIFEEGRVVRWYPRELSWMGYGVREDQPDSPVLYRMESRYEALAKVIGRGLYVPSRGLTALHALLQNIQALVPVIYAPGLAPQGQSLYQGHTRPYCLLWPFGDGLRLALRMRPLGDRGGYVRLGGNGVINIQDDDGQLVLVQRDLSAESQAVQAIVAGVPLLRSTPEVDGEWFLPNLQNALDLLLQLEALGDAVRVHWPDGVCFRSDHLSDRPQLHLALVGDRVSITGTLTVHDGKVLSLPNLLQMHMGRYLRLADDHFLKITREMAALLTELHPHLDRGASAVTLHPLQLPALAEVFPASQNTFREHRAANAQESPDMPPHLRPYQQEGYKRLVQLALWGAGFCLADDMGLGKTVQTLALLQHRASLGPALILATADTCAHWRGAARRFAPNLRLTALSRQSKTEPGTVVLGSYADMVQWITSLATIRWQTLILDDAHVLLQSGTQRARAVGMLTAETKLALTNRPVLQDLRGLWSLFKILDPRLLGDRSIFMHHFVHPLEEGDDLALRRLSRRISPFIVRREKYRVNQALPARTDIVLRIPLSEQERHVYEGLIENDSRQLRLACCHPKLVQSAGKYSGAKFETFRQRIAGISAGRHRTLIFSMFTAHIGLLCDELDRQKIGFQHVTTKDPPAVWQRALQVFRAGEGLVGVIGPDVADASLVGIEVDYILVVDPCPQRNAVIQRLSRKKPLIVYHLIAADTIEDQSG